MQREIPGDELSRELAAEAITVRIRWFGLAVGYALVNLFDRHESQAVLNAILTLGAVYAVVDSLWSLRGKVFLSDWPLVISLMEAVFIGLLCYYDRGLESPFRYYYFLSLLVCAIRHAPWIAWLTCLTHAASFAGLAFIREDVGGQGGWTTLFLMLVLMGWFTWASTALAALLMTASRRLRDLNTRLRENQSLLEERIEQRTRELAESQALVVQQEKQAAFGLLAAGIAHEVGNPLAAISSLVQMLNRRHSDEYTRERLQMVDDQLRRIQRTLRELVDFSRPAATEKSRCDVCEVFDAALSIAKYYKRTKGKQIITHFDEALPAVRVVRDQLVQVFLNLVLNAMDATPEGGTIAIAAHAERAMVPRGGRESAAREHGIRVTVTDDGVGIPPGDRQAVFEPYFTTKETGTGLGLFVCRRIVEQMRGRIELADSSPGRTTFAVTLPGEEAEWTATSVEECPSASKPSSTSRTPDLPGSGRNSESDFSDVIAPTSASARNRGERSQATSGLAEAGPSVATPP